MCRKKNMNLKSNNKIMAEELKQTVFAVIFTTITVAAHLINCTF